MKKYVLLLCLLCYEICFAQPVEFLYMSYNVENLFDTIDNPQKNDEDFLPTSERKWNSYRYQKKLTNISKVIVSASEDWHNPDVVGLCEVENDTCLHDLLHRTNLYKLHYKYVHYDSEDPRGIDVALLYNEETVQPIKHFPIRVTFDDSTKKTRDVLYFQGLIKSNNDTIHIFQCHFPSRRGGKELSEPFRMQVANKVREQVDSIFRIDSTANIIIAGDFNDYPNDRSITEGLSSQKFGTECTTCLVSLEDKHAEGTYKFQGQWNFLDHAIVSNTLISKYDAQYTVLQNEFILDKSEKTGETSPHRTYLGPFYKGGVSDHLPITVKLLKKK